MQGMNESPMTSKACRSGVTEKGSWNIQVWQVPWQTSPASLEFEPRCQLRLEQGQFQSCGSWCAPRHAWPHGSCAADSVLVQYIGHRIQIETSCDLFPWAKHVSMFEVSWMRHPHTVWNRSPNYAQSQMLCPKLFDGVLNCLVVVSNALDDFISTCGCWEPPWAHIPVKEDLISQQPGSICWRYVFPSPLLV